MYTRNSGYWLYPKQKFASHFPYRTSALLVRSASNNLQIRLGSSEMFTLKTLFCITMGMHESLYSSRKEVIVTMSYRQMGRALLRAPWDVLSAEIMLAGRVLQGFLCIHHCHQWFYNLNMALHSSCNSKLKSATQCWAWMMTMIAFIKPRYSPFLSRLLALLSHVILSNCSFLQRVFKYPLKWCTYSAVWLLHGWCHMKLLPCWRIMCTP